MLKSRNEYESPVSREGGFLLNNLLFLTAAFAVFWGVMFPVLSEAVTGSKVTVGPPFFSTVMTPIRSAASPVDGRWTAAGLAEDLGSKPEKTLLPDRASSVSSAAPRHSPLARANRTR